MTNIDRLVDAVSGILADKMPPPTEEELSEYIKALAPTVAKASGQPISESDYIAALKAIETRFSIRMSMGTMFHAEDYRPWLISKQGEIPWYYWDRYRNYLVRKKGFPPDVVRSLDKLTDKILDHTEDPKKEGKWIRRGLVVGHVQSGKTANYTGLMCKAADAGYRVIIVLAGTLNSLRNQTQERIDSDFIGWCTRTKVRLGAADFATERRQPICFTSSDGDFDKRTANAIALTLDSVKEPVVLIIKKNKSTLENLCSWFKENNRHNLQNFPMLLIDDEADHASINTNSDDEDPTAINKAIRGLLSLFDRASFVGYTATPFANIFIDPDSDEEMENGAEYRDLFPRDFILSLDPPDNYIGPQQILTDSSTLNCVRDIDDNVDYLPIRHKIDFIPERLPDSLKHALACFFLTKTIRLLREQTNKHHSMMVNASRFTKVQNMLAGIISDQVKQFKQSIVNYAGLPQGKALQNKDLAFLHDVFQEEFPEAGFSWAQVQGRLREAADPVEIVVVNGSSRDRLDYSARNYPDGRSVIAVGGLGLSRGLTLEGLITSYFLRNSIMYDTLMQMGRWFGYRDGYADVCRIFMTPTAASWYSHIADATEELRKDFKTMERAKLTPKEFGLRVRSHPTALIVTARNKMRTGRKVPMQIALEGRLAETSVLLGDDESLAHNSKVMETVCHEAEKEIHRTEQKNLGYLWKSVSPSIVISAIQSFRNHPENILTYADPLVQYIESLESSGARFDILLRSSSEKGVPPYSVDGLDVTPIRRTIVKPMAARIEFKKRRVASKGDERAGLTEEEIAKVKDEHKTEENLPDRYYRDVPGRNPLFMIFFAKVSEEENGGDYKIAPAYGVSFPGDSGSGRRPKRLVEYIVTTTWWKKNYGDDLQEDAPEEQ
jgi:hypothetical protein